MTIEEWYASDTLDWSRRRNAIKPLFYGIANTDLSNYNNLNDAEKLIGAKCFFAPYSLRVDNGVVTEAEDILNWDVVLIETKESRLKCVESMRLYVGQLIRVSEFTLTNTQTFFDVVSVYMTLFMETNNPSFKQWLTNKVGTNFEFKGFKNTSYWSQEVEDGLLSIYNGNY
jgi:hypothetical protein